MMSTTNQSSVILDNVDDYLAPSQACINPLFQPTQPAEATTTTEATKDEGVVRPRRRKVVRKPILAPATSIEDQMEKIPINDDQKGDHKKAETIKASIADCLACSGCVTTAETVLLEQHHSLTSLQQRLSSTNDQPGRHSYRVLTLSPNSLADLCRHWKLSPPRHLPRLVTLLHQILKVNVVVDGNVPLEWTWQEEAEEFVQHYRQRNQEGATAATSSSLPPPPSTAIDSTRTMYYLPDGTTPIVSHDPTISSSSTSLDPYAVPTRIPLLSGSCPALVCWVEKSMSALVPHLSRTLSPMTRLGLAMMELDGDCEHWAIMPCHDKKLEASRKDFLLIQKSKESGQQEQPKQAVDLVLTTMELVELMEEYWRGISSPSTTIATKTDVVIGNSSEASSLLEYLESLQPATTWSPDNKEWSIPKLQQQLQQHSVIFWTNTHTWTESPRPSSESDRIAFHSGGHADYIFRYAAQQLFGCTISHVQWTPTLPSMNSLTNGSSTIKSQRLANLQKKQQSYQAILYRQQEPNSLGESYTQQEEAGQQEAGHEPVLRFAMVRGMQTMQRTLKDLDTDSSSSLTTWDYVEAMACPHGCVNGGGSVRTHKESMVTIKETPTETKLRVDQTLQALIIPKPSATTMVTTVPHSPRPRFQTRYHVVPPMHHTLGAAAGVKVQDMQW